MNAFELKIERAYNELQRDIADANAEIWRAQSFDWQRRRFALHMLRLKTAIIAADLRRNSWARWGEGEFDANQIYYGLYRTPLNGWGIRNILPQTENPPTKAGFRLPTPALRSAAAVAVRSVTAARPPAGDLVRGSRLRVRAAAA